MPYTRVTSEERTRIYDWKQAGKSNGEIARLLKRDKSTIGREFRRNTGKRGYRPQQAQQFAEERAKRPGPRRFTREVREDAEEKLRLGWTPEAISGRARAENRAWVCKETIYKHVYADAKAGGTLWRHLPRAKRRRKRRCPRADRRGIIPDRRMIDERPPEVDQRLKTGHWEGDLVSGAHGTGNLVTLVERKTRFALVARTDSKEAGEVADAICALFAGLPPAALSSVTFDNGKEFAKHKRIEKEAGLEVYFAHPYHAWERGSNENANGLIRRLYPKRSSFADLGEDGLARIESHLNDRPRKCLGWATAREAMEEFLRGNPAPPPSLRRAP